MVGTTHAEIIHSRPLQLTKTRQLESKISNLESLDKINHLHWSNVHCSCFLAQSSLLLLLMSFSSGFFATIRPWRPDSRSLLWTVDVEMCLLLEVCEVCLSPHLVIQKLTTTDTSKKKRLAWAKKHEQWTLDRWESVLWSDESKFEIFGSSRWFDDLCMCGSHRGGWRRRCDGAGVLCWWHCLWFILNSRHT